MIQRLVGFIDNEVNKTTADILEDWKGWLEEAERIGDIIKPVDQLSEEEKIQIIGCAVQVQLEDADELCISLMSDDEDVVEGALQALLFYHRFQF